MTDRQPLIQLHDVSYIYLRGKPDETLALDGVSAEVFTGETVAVIGSTGSGKSTLLQHLNGLLHPHRGRVLIDGIPLDGSSADLRRVRQRVGLLFQNPEDQLFERYAGDDVAFGPRNLGLSRDEVYRRVQHAMEDVGLPFHYKDRLTADLSQGQRRRLALAGILAMDPQVLVLDEPTAGLDPQGRQRLLAILSAWQQKRDRALVLATHNMEDVAALANRVYVLARGRIVLQGTPCDVFAHEDVLVAGGLVPPVITQVLQELRARHYALSLAALTPADMARRIEELPHGHH